MARAMRELGMPFLEGLSNIVHARREARHAARGILYRPTGTAVLASDIPSARTAGPGDRALAEIDRDGFAFAYDSLDEPYFNRRRTRLPRVRCRLEVVALRGVVCIRKTFVSKNLLGLAPRERLQAWLGSPFFIEAAALGRLRGVEAVPALVEIDLRSRSIYCEYVRGANLRHAVAQSGVAIHDLETRSHTTLGRLTQRELDDRERMVSRSMFGAKRAEIGALVSRMNERGVAPLDVKLGNLVLCERTGALNWIDFETARLVVFGRWDETILEQNRRIAAWFGDGADEAASAGL